MFQTLSGVALGCRGAQRRHTFFRSYGANLPSSLTTVLSSALGCSPRLPVSVYGTVSSVIISEAFLGSRELISSGPSPPHHLSALPLRLSPSRPRVTAYGFKPLTNVWLIYPSPSLLASMNICWCRNINLLSIAYAFRPRLRIRLTLGGLTWPRKPGVYGERVSRPFYRYSCLHKLFQKLHASFRSRFSVVGILSYHSVESVASVPYFSPGTFSAQVH